MTAKSSVKAAGAPSARSSCFQGRKRLTMNAAVPEESKTIGFSKRTGHGAMRQLTGVAIISKGPSGITGKTDSTFK
jgi:hypothetical protein